MTTPTTTAVNPQLLNNSPESIAKALALLSNQALADLTTLMGGQPGGSTAFKCRCVVNTTLSAYTGTGTGVLTASANGTTLSVAQDTNVTLAVGDTVFVPEGITNISANSDAGPYVVTALGGASAEWVLTRPTWWAKGATAQIGQVIEIGGEGAKWGGTQWKAFGAEGSLVVDTNDPGFYPGRVTTKVTLASGTFALTGIPIYSATATGVTATRIGLNGSTVTSTIMYAVVAGPTAGFVSTGASSTAATVTIDAVVAAGTVNAADNSFLLVTITNW